MILLAGGLVFGSSVNPIPTRGQIMPNKLLLAPTPPDLKALGVLQPHDFQLLRQERLTRRLFFHLCASVHGLFWPFGLAMTINWACYKKCITRSLIVSYCPNFSNALNCFQATNKSRKYYMHSFLWFQGTTTKYKTFLLKTYLKVS